MPVVDVHTVEEIAGLRDQVHDRLRQARQILQNLDNDPMTAFCTIKFEQLGCHPLEDRSLNLIEQINQSFTYLASFAGARRLMELHPNCGGMRLHLGTTNGRDIESIHPGVVGAEVFTATAPNNNGSMTKNISRLRAAQVAHYRYLFFYVPGIVPVVPGIVPVRQYGLEDRYNADGIQIYALSLNDL